MGLVVGIPRFLSLQAPERISSQCLGAPGGCGLVFEIYGPGDSHLCVRGRKFTRGSRCVLAGFCPSRPQRVSPPGAHGHLVGMSWLLRSLARVTVFSARSAGDSTRGLLRMFAGFCSSWPQRESPPGARGHLVGMTWWV
jgi:hypothetical protein